MNLPLQDKVFISTRPSNSSDELSQLLTIQGATVIEMPLIEIKAANISEEDLRIFYSIYQFNWIIFTSANGVVHFFNVLKKQTGSTRLPHTINFAVIGTKTEKKLQEFGYTASFVNPGNSAEDFAEPFMNHIKTASSSLRILLPLGNLARTYIQDQLSQVASCTRIDIYNTVEPATVDDDILKRIKENNYDMILFTSPSGIRQFVKVCEHMQYETIRIACIGPVTQREATNVGFRPLVTAQKSSAEGIVQNILNYYISKK